MLTIIIFSLILVGLIGLVIWSFKKSPQKPNPKQQGQFRRYAQVMIVVLIVQFFAGLAVNLWITLPKHHPGTKASNFFGGVYDGIKWAILHSGIAILIVHIIVAFALVGLTIRFTISAMLKLNRFWIKVNALGAFFILGAFFNGASYLNYSEQVSSLLMEIFFVLAISTYLGALYISKPSR